MKRLFGILLAMGSLVFLSPGCYTLKSQSIPVGLKTINIGFFENNATLVVPTLSQLFTEALKDRIRSTTRLSIVTSEGDARMTGAITDYRIAPISIQATNNNAPPIAGASVLSITVQVKFVYDKDKEKGSAPISFDQTFTKTMNFSGDISAQEQTLIVAINKQLIDDIFNKAFNNW
jgi:hypothetical protein